MFDVFMKFSDYSMLVRSIVVGWVIFTAILAIVLVFAKPIKKEIEQIKAQPSKSENKLGSSSDIQNQDTLHKVSQVPAIKMGGKNNSIGSARIQGYEQAVQMDGEGNKIGSLNHKR